MRDIHFGMQTKLSETLVVPIKQYGKNNQSQCPDAVVFVPGSSRKAVATQIIGPRKVKESQDCKWLTKVYVSPATTKKSLGSHTI